MSFNPLALLQERQCAPIYDALDTGKPSLALKQCEKLLLSQPELHLASALKAIALLRLGQTEEAGEISDRLINSQATLKSTSVLKPLCMVLSSLERYQDEAELVDAASKASPTSIELGSQSFLAMVKTQQWQKAQQTALRVHKIVSAKDKKNDYFFWSSMQAYSLVANDASLPGSQLALPLAQRMIAKHLYDRPFGPKSDEIMFLYASIMRKMGTAQAGEALKLLSSEGRGRELCKRSLTLADLRLQLMKQLEDWKTVYIEALDALDAGDRNWARVEEAVMASIQLALKEASSSIRDLENRLTNLAAKSKQDRTLRLAPLYFIKEATKSKLTPNGNLLGLFTAYFEDFCSKACAHEDLAPYAVLLSKQERQTASQYLHSHAQPPVNGSFNNLDELYRSINACKLDRLLLLPNDITHDTENAAARRYYELYLCALPLGNELPKTEMQPADDFALLTAQSLLHARVLQMQTDSASASGEATATMKTNLSLAVLILTCALRASPKGYRLRVLLIQLLRQQGAIDSVRREYEQIGVKAIQQDTLGWIIANRCASSIVLLKQGSKEEESLVASVRRLQSVWREGRTQVPQMVAKAFSSGIFSRVEEMVTFGDKLDHSLTKWLLSVEMARSNSLVKGSRKDWAAELQSCRASLDSGGVSNQQDYDVLLDLAPSESIRVAELSSAAAKRPPGIAYLKAILPVALLRLNSPLQESDAAEVEQCDELTAEEILLSRLAAALSREDKDLIEGASSRLFESIKLTCKAAKANDLPCKVLHAASIGLEAFELLATVRDRVQEKAGWSMDIPCSSLASIAESLKQLSSPTPEALSGVWVALLQKSPPTLLGGANIAASVEQTNRELSKEQANAREALVDRIEKALNAPAV